MLRNASASSARAMISSPASMGWNPMPFTSSITMALASSSSEATYPSTCTPPILGLVCRAARAVVKAFNTALAARQTNPKIGGVHVDGYVASDDEEAKAIVIELVKGMGFHPIDAGELIMARALEALAFLNISLQMRHGWSWQAGWKLVGPEGDAS